MTFARKAALSVFLIIGVIVAGFIFLLRGCLSKYDERSALPGILYFENGNKQVIFSISKFEKATSYSQKGGITSKSVSTNYFIQTNDATTAQKVGGKKIMHQRNIKNHPVEILGASGNTAWVFINELMAFDPFTLEQKAGLSQLEEKNPSLKGKLPAERRFYVFDRLTKNIHITAKDGSVWQLNTQTLQASPYEEANDKTSKSTVEALEELLQLNREAQDSLYEKKLRAPSRLLAAGQINRNQYNELSKGFNEDRTILYQERDSLQDLIRNAEKINRGTEEIRRKIESLQERNNISFSQLKANADTSGGNWYGIYSSKEIDKLYDRFQYQSLYDETARRQLYSSTYSKDRNGDIIIAKNNAVVKNSSSYFLDGGYLLDKQTGMPVRTKDQSSLIIHKNEIGNQGKIQVSLVTRDSNALWTFDSGLKEWANYIFTGDRLFILGTDNPELSGHDCNVLWCLDLKTGKAAKYDYTPNP